jgi:ribosome-associated translation inhibitor RaiA
MSDQTSDHVNELDFAIEFKAEGLNEVTEADLFDETYERLQKLTKGHTDIVGAAVNITKPAQAETSFIFEATVVVYGRPDHTAATEKGDNPTIALKGALDALERQVRSRREKLGQPWQQHGN